LGSAQTAFADSSADRSSDAQADPYGMQMNLFDYWIISQNENDQYASAAWGSSANSSSWYANKGINAGHTLKFHQTSGNPPINPVPGDGKSDTSDNYNGNLTPATSPRKLGAADLVQKNLLNGYPLLNHLGIGSDASSLNYLFDPSVSVGGKASYMGAHGLLRANADGEYYYDSKNTWAKFDTSSKSFALTALSDSQEYNFYPFDKSIAPGHKKDHNHYFGMTMTAPFMQPTDGTVFDHNGNSTDMKFHFSGDDDMWLFIDGVLVGDVGGIHGATALDIDFSDGSVKVSQSGNDLASTTLKQAFTDAGQAGSTSWRGNTFADNTAHKIQMFYLERGNGPSNLEIRFNFVAQSNFTAEKQMDGQQVDLKDKYRFELRGYRNKDRFADAIMPTGAALTSGRDGMGSYQAVTASSTANGSVDFGNMQFGSDQMGKAFAYTEREVIPEGATATLDGVTIAYRSATDHQRARVRDAGGIWTYRGISYDPTVYYVKAQFTTDYGLVKTYYSDEAMTKQVNTARPTFKNASASAADIPLVFTKQLVGGGLAQGAFSFAIAQTDGSLPAGYATTAANSADGTVAFAVPGFTVADFSTASTLTRTYTVSEMVPSDAVNADGTAYVDRAAAGASGPWVKNGIQYSDQVVTVTVTGTYDAMAAASTYPATGPSVQVSYRVDGKEYLPSSVPAFVNTPVTDVTATKVWDDGDAAPSTHPAVTLRLMRQTNGGEAQAVAGADKTILAGATGGDLTVAWRNLPAKDDAGNALSYSVKEEPITGYAVSYTGDASTGITVTNARHYAFQLTKKGQSADASDPVSYGTLAGAHFTVRDADGSYLDANGQKGAVPVDLTTGDDGTIAVSNLPTGTFKITETQAPAGYQLPSGSMTLEVHGDGTATFTSFTGTTASLQAGTSGDAADVFSVEVTDIRAVDSLPQTGGIGRLALCLAGVAAVAGAVALLRLARRA
jgi:fibro-slime domain-containing protein